MFAELARALSGQGPLNWDAARQFALLAAAGGETEPNVDPDGADRFTDLSRIAALHVADVTGSDIEYPEVQSSPAASGHSRHSRRTVTCSPSWRHRSAGSATTIRAPIPTTGADDPMMAMMAGFNKMLAPAMMGMSVGSMVGSLARRAFGIYDLPDPPRAARRWRSSPARSTASPPSGRSRSTRCACGCSPTSSPGTRCSRLPTSPVTSPRLVRQHAAGFRPDPSALTDKLGSLDVSGNPMEAMQQAFNDPEILLGAVRSPEQIALEPQLDSAVAVVIGYLDWVVDAVSVRVVGGNALRIAEAVRRRRLETTPDDHVRRSACSASDSVPTRWRVASRSCRESSTGPASRRSRRCSPDPTAFPTVAEVDAPGLWLARLEA